MHIVKNSPASGFATQFNAQPPTGIILSYSWVCHIICTTRQSSVNISSYIRCTAAGLYQHNPGYLNQSPISTTSMTVAFKWSMRNNLGRIINESFFISLYNLLGSPTAAMPINMYSCSWALDLYAVS